MMSVWEATDRTPKRGCGGVVLARSDTRSGSFWLVLCKHVHVFPEGLRKLVLDLSGFVWICLDVWISDCLDVWISMWTCLDLSGFVWICACEHLS